MGHGGLVYWPARLPHSSGRMDLHANVAIFGPLILVFLEVVIVGDRHAPAGEERASMLWTVLLV